MIIIADASPLISLAEIGRFGLLEQIYHEIVVPPAVFSEVVTRGRSRPGADEIKGADWIQLQGPANLQQVQILARKLGAGESEAIILAQDLQADLVLADDSSARRELRALNIPFTGTGESWSKLQSDSLFPPSNLSWRLCAIAAFIYQNVCTNPHSAALENESLSVG
jgi:predicted nucleic acid-binding protein